MCRVAISTGAGNDVFSGRGGAFAASHLAGSPLSSLSAVSMSLTVFVLAIWGFADNWLRPRAQRA